MSELSTFLSEWSSLIAILAILIGTIAIRVVLKVLSNRLVSSLVRGVKKTKNGKPLNNVLADQRIAQRSKTIASVLDNFATWVLAITALVMILSQLGINVGALIAVSTIVGAAIGFGGQSLVKDIISGIFIVFEDQYGVGDEVKLGDVEGEVVRVRLRVTEIKASDGTIWYVRNGEILNVGNRSQKS